MTIKEKCPVDLIKEFIITRKYWCKTESLAKSKWRKRIADEWVKEKAKHSINATVEDFIQAWEELKQSGNI